MLYSRLPTRCSICQLHSRIQRWYHEGTEWQSLRNRITRQQSLTAIFTNGYKAPTSHERQLPGVHTVTCLASSPTDVENVQNYNRRARGKERGDCARQLSRVRLHIRIASWPDSRVCLLLMLLTNTIGFSCSLHCQRLDTVYDEDDRCYACSNVEQIHT